MLTTSLISGNSTTPFNGHHSSDTVHIIRSEDRVADGNVAVAIRNWNPGAQSQKANKRRCFDLRPPSSSGFFQIHPTVTTMFAHWMYIVASDMVNTVETQAIIDGE
ncbi:unnamed protein product [Nippostrongylus brasiliensis]|uniref:Uncharacterized protein n=1 Tax=Nippostrongylus brasiliensis TaxID=27835 RepID=A0A0N4YS36_NIPBR|nr:unnamed protein product [Nippostrongylus brasiliensis]